MQKIFSRGAELEKLSKEKFFIPPFLMMENAARAMADFILTKKPESLLIFCGKGNNGGDGYALGRMLQDKVQVTILSVEEPATEEAITQHKMCTALGINIIKTLPENLKADVIVDCLYGIGFHGDLRPQARELLDSINLMPGIKIACDIPSGLYFNADYTITMGEQKTSLYSDKAKAVCGEIIVADLGIAREQFQSQMLPDAFLIEADDMLLPVRKNRKAHKGTYGHTAVFAGEKSGAGIIAATAAMNSGSGLTTLVKTVNSNLEQFQITPELMISSEIPAKTTCLIAGPGLGTNHADLEKQAETILKWAESVQNPSLVFDADMITWQGLPDLLHKLNQIEKIRIVLTPHLSELARFTKEYDVQTLANNADAKLELAAKLNEKYPKTAVIMKSANTFIACSKKVYICADGAQSLAKGGSGDVLAGITGALLAQGYELQDALITAVEAHAMAAVRLGPESYDLTPLKLIDSLNCLLKN